MLHNDLFEGCAVPIFIGDGSCDDEANNADCNYDGGDCCLECMDTSLCSECLCHDRGAPINDTSCSKCSYAR